MLFRRLKHDSILHRDAIRSGDREFSHCCRSPAADHARTRLERGSRASVQHMCGAIYSYGSRPRVQPLATALSLSRVRPYAEAAGKYPVDLLSAAARSLRCLLRADPDPIFIDCAPQRNQRCERVLAFRRKRTSACGIRVGCSLAGARLDRSADASATRRVDDALLWSGLLVNLEARFAPLADAVIGALAGYLSLWLIAWLFRLVRNKEGMGQGDFKLLAALGAWFGWMALPSIALLASTGGMLCGVAACAYGRLKKHQPLPFGPFLAAAGALALFWTPPWMQWQWMPL